MKKAQGISINVIVIAAVALLVLVVLAVVFLGRFGQFAEKSQDCIAKGGGKASCVIGVCPDGTTWDPSSVCPESTAGADQRCCLRIA